MGLSWNEKERRYEWTGSVRNLVAAVGDGDARLGFVVDLKSGAKISMNISGSDDPMATEPFLVESPDSENLYDASNRAEAVKLLFNARRGEKRLDEDLFSFPKKRKAKRTAKKKPSPKPSVRGMRS